MRRKDREARDDVGGALLNQILALRTTASQVLREDYQGYWEANGVEFYETLFPAAERFYQQLHAAVETSVHMLLQAAECSLAAKSLARLVDELNGAPRHPLASAVRQRERQLRLLRWLGTVRNKAVQHRVREGYTDNAAIVLPDGYVLVRKPGPAPAEVARKAKQLLRGLTRTHSLRLDESPGSHENIAYLDLVSHGLLQQAPGHADPARAIVEEARVHHLVVSQAFMDNVDWALGALIELTPVPPAHPGA